MKSAVSLMGIAMLLLVACSKKSDSGTDNSTGSGGTTPTQAAILVDPVNCPPTLYQNNAIAFQISFAKMKLVKGMTGTLTNVTPTVMANNNIHVYLRATNGTYYHLPATTAAGIAYNYSIKAASPASTLTITRGTGAEEIFETVIVLGATTTYLSGLNRKLILWIMGRQKIN